MVKREFVSGTSSQTRTIESTRHTESQRTFIKLKEAIHAFSLLVKLSEREAEWMRMNLCRPDGAHEEHTRHEAGAHVHS